MSVTIIAAVANNGVIGLENRLPWHCPEDLRRFKQLTMGKAVIMGRKTWESLPGPLSGRTCVVVSNSPPKFGFSAVPARSLEDAIHYAETLDLEPCVIGGAEIYRLAMPQANQMLITRIHQSPEGDTYFPEIDLAAWRLVDVDARPDLSFETWRKK